MYPHVATGFSDTSAFLRELTLKSMLILAPKVFACTLVIEFLHYDVCFEVYFNDVIMKATFHAVRCMRFIMTSILVHC